MGQINKHNLGAFLIERTGTNTQHGIVFTALFLLDSSGLYLYPAHVKYRCICLDI